MDAHDISARLDALPRVFLAHLPTPIVTAPRLSRQLGVDLLVKRDDANGGAEAGNKLRKLELLLARALREGCDTILTCGGAQSNHARATALASARLGLSSVLFLRTASGLPLAGNVLLDRFAGAELRAISAEQYRDRDRLMAEAAEELARAGRRPFVIPEGGSNALGALGYVLAMREVREQLDAGLAGSGGIDFIVHACGSGGTAAGAILGSRVFGVGRHVLSFAVCDDSAYFAARIRGILDDAESVLETSVKIAPSSWSVDDSARGPAYAVSVPEQRRLMREVCRLSGLVLDPVYTGKAMFGLAQAVEQGRIPKGSRVLFLHTGGLAGLLAEPEVFEGEL